MTLRALPGAADSWLARIRREREAALTWNRRGLRRGDRIGIVVLATFCCVVFPALLHVLAGTWPLSVAVGAMSTLVLGLAYVLGSAAQRDALRRELARLDAKVEDVARLLATRARELPPPANAVTASSEAAPAVSAGNAAASTAS